MNWNQWKPWALVGAVAVALATIYAFASPGDSLRSSPASQARAATSKLPGRGASAIQTAGGIQPVHVEWLEPRSASYSSGRNLFAFVEPPPPPPVVVKPPPPPADRDKDGVPDFQDNCPDVPNADQKDIDHNGIGTVCQEGVESPPPPPKPQPPAFPYKYIGTFGSASKPIAAFSSGDEIVNVRVGQTFGKHFILRKIGIESVDIGFVGFPPDERKRVPIGK